MEAPALRRERRWVCTSCDSSFTLSSDDCRRLMSSSFARRVFSKPLARVLAPATWGLEPRRCECDDGRETAHRCRRRPPASIQRRAAGGAAPTCEPGSIGRCGTDTHLICVWNTGGDDGDACAGECECMAEIHASGQRYRRASRGERAQDRRARRAQRPSWARPSGAPQHRPWARGWGLWGDQAPLEAA